MIFPMPSMWFGTTPDENVARRVDRYEDAKGHRMAVGLHLDAKYSKITGSLLIVSGHGKYLKPKTWSSCELEVPSELTQLLSKLSESESVDLTEFSLAKSELATLQSQVVQRLNEMAGKYVDRILAICVVDPGLWKSDFDGSPIYHGLCDPIRLAETTGHNVIDSFPARDIENGGSGVGLSAIPLWLMLADRNEREATHTRVAILCGPESTLFLLPGSDGLDKELPDVLLGNTPGENGFNALLRQFAPNELDKRNATQTERLATNGRKNDSLINEWDQITSAHTAQHTKHSLKPDSDRMNRELIQVASHAVEKGTAVVDLLRSYIVWATNQVEEWISKASFQLPLDNIKIAGESPFATLLINELSNRFGAIQCEGETELQIDSVGNLPELSATVAAMLGFLNIDQMPGNLPWITGCTDPRILGRITPGRPANWRQLLIEMADYRPPAMKLKDAV